MDFSGSSTIRVHNQYLMTHINVKREILFWFENIFGQHKGKTWCVIFASPKGIFLEGKKSNKTTSIRMIQMPMFWIGPDVLVLQLQVLPDEPDVENNNRPQEYLICLEFWCKRRNVYSVCLLIPVNIVTSLTITPVKPGVGNGNETAFA